MELLTEPSRRLFWLIGQLFVLMVATNSYAETIVGHVVSFKGHVNIDRAVDGLSVEVTPNLPIYLEDMIRSDVDGHLKLLLRDKSVLTIGPDSRLKINAITVPGLGEQTAIELLGGWLRALVSKASLDRQYEVRTAVAVAGVRGTDFDVLHTSERLSAVRCRDGAVAVRNIDSSVIGEAILGASQFTYLTETTPPIKPMVISPQESLQLKLRETQKKIDGSDEQNSEESLRPIGEDISLKQVQESLLQSDEDIVETFSIPGDGSRKVQQPDSRATRAILSVADIEKKIENEVVESPMMEDLFAPGVGLEEMELEMVNEVIELDLTTTEVEIGELIVSEPVQKHMTQVEPEQLTEIIEAQIEQNLTEQEKQPERGDPSIVPAIVTLPISINIPQL